MKIKKTLIFNKQQPQKYNFQVTFTHLLNTLTDYRQQNKKLLKTG